jgi:hypothetical protein
MGLVDLKSDLSQIRQFKQPSYNVAAKKYRAPFDKSTPDLKSVNNFTDNNAIGFITNKTQGNTDFIINTPVASTLAKQTANNTYENTIVDSEKTPSPIQILHNKESSLTGNFPLSEYYSQLNTENQLGIRKSSKFGPEQPFVVRKIGDSWDKNSSSDLYDNAGTKLSDNDNLRFGSYTRLDKFLLSPAGDLFLSKQRDFMRGNAQKFRTDVRYGLTKSLDLVDENPRKYDIQSLTSNTPGNGKIDILARDSSLTLGFGNVQTIANLISEEVIKLATTATDKVVRTLKGVATDISKQIGGALLDKIDKGGEFRKKVKKVEAKVDAFNTLAGNTGGLISKAKGVILGDNKVFADVGKDLVNLIPYGSDEIKGRSYRDLDFIPFKFYDVNNKKSIVFRALLSGITDTFTPEYASERYIGRPDNVYVYTGTTREISFTFDIMPKSDEELLVLWEKMNYLAGLTYPSWTESGAGGQGMVAPFCKLTLGQMYDNTSGYISGLTYTVMDSSTWETTFAKLPKYIQASVSFVYIGDRLPSSTQKHYEGPWIAEEEYQSALNELFGDFSIGGVGVANLLGGNSSELGAKVLGAAGLGD